MENGDFAMPSPKRQRTTSPEIAHDTANRMSEEASTKVREEPPNEQHDDETTINYTTATKEENDMLDALMQHVEAEADPVTVADHYTSAVSGADQSTHPLRAAEMLMEENETEETNGVSESQSNNLHEKAAKNAEQHLAEAASEVLSMNDRPTIERIENHTHAGDVDAIPPMGEVEPVEGEGEPEWELDSSPYESSSDSLSSDSSSSDDDEEDDDADGDYDMLDPEEAARILMHGDMGSDDEGDRSKNKGDNSGLRTTNEKLEDVPPIPEITITEEMKIEELGTVEAIVENNVLIKAKVSGEYQVLESGSLLCLQNRHIAGVIAETLGRVEQPLYTVRLRNSEEIERLGLSQKGTIVYYVQQHSSFVFTQPLKAFKGSDASNFHDEEVGDEEMEFSDDEAEAEHKRQLKLKRRGRTGEATKSQGTSRGGRGGHRGGYKPSPLSTDPNSTAYGNGSLEMNYDDVEDGEDGYTPLSRPSNFHEMATNPTQPDETYDPSHMPPPSFSDRGRGRGSHRGGRNHDRGGRGGRNNARANGTNNNNNNRGNSYQRPQPNNNHSPIQHSNPFPYPFSPPQHHQHQQQYGPFPFSQPPSAPSLVPQNSSYPYSTITSPISPLPKSQFNFNAGFSIQPSLPQQSLSPTHFAQQQQQQQWSQPMPPGFTPAFNNPAAVQFAWQHQQGQNIQQNGQQQQQQQLHNSQWQVNQAAAAEVQRQLDEMRKNRR